MVFRYIYSMLRYAYAHNSSLEGLSADEVRTVFEMMIRNGWQHGDVVVDVPLQGEKAVYCPVFD